MSIRKTSPVSSQIVGHRMNGVQQLAQLRHMIALLQTELRHRHGHRYLPSLALLVECPSQLLHKVQEYIFVTETATTIGRSRILPVQIESVESVFVHVLHNTGDERAATLLLGHHLRILAATFAPAANGQLELQTGMVATQSGEVAEAIIVNVDL